MVERIAYSAQEAAEAVGVPYGTILAEIRGGRLVARRVEKEYRVYRDVLDEYLKCPDLGSQPASTSAPIRASGSSETAPRTSAQGASARNATAKTLNAQAVTMKLIAGSRSTRRQN